MKSKGKGSGKGKDNTATAKGKARAKGKDGKGKEKGKGNGKGKPSDGNAKDKRQRGNVEEVEGQRPRTRRQRQRQLRQTSWQEPLVWQRSRQVDFSRAGRSSPWSWQPSSWHTLQSHEQQALHVFWKRVRTLNRTKVIALRKCGIGAGRVYIHDADERSACRADLGEIDWPVEYAFEAPTLQAHLTFWCSTVTICGLKQSGDMAQQTTVAGAL